MRFILPRIDPSLRRSNVTINGLPTTISHKCRTYLVRFHELEEEIRNKQMWQLKGTDDKRKEELSRRVLADWGDVQEHSRYLDRLVESLHVVDSFSETLTRKSSLREGAEVSTSGSAEDAHLQQLAPATLSPTKQDMMNEILTVSDEYHALFQKHLRTYPCFRPTTETDKLWEECRQLVQESRTRPCWPRHSNWEGKLSWLSRMTDAELQEERAFNRRFLDAMTKVDCMLDREWEEFCSSVERADFV